MDVPIIEAPLYLQNLLDQFEDAGGTIEIREVESLQELVNERRLLVNCTGIGARKVAADPAVYPIRGQTALIDAPQIVEGYMNFSEVTHLFPRGDGVLIGGVYQYGNWNREIDPDLTRDIIARCARIEPSVAQAQIIRQFVGLRPGRDKVRLEVERITTDCAVIHNYGHAATGFTLSWGCAKAVLELARNLSKR